MVNFSIIFAITSLLVTTSVAQQPIYNQDVCVTTYAGNPWYGSYKNGPRKSAYFQSVGGLSFDSIGNLYVVDAGNLRVRMIDTKGTVTTFAGTGIPTKNVVDDQYLNASFNQLHDIAIDTKTNTVYICDNILIRKLAGGKVTTIAGSDGDDVQYRDGIGKNARLGCNALTIFNREMYFGDYMSHTVRKDGVNNYVSTIAGKFFGDADGYGIPGFADGPVSKARFDHPSSVVVDTNGRVFVCDSGNYVVRMIVGGTVSTFAGGDLAHNARPISGFRDGPGNQALFEDPIAMTIDENNNIYLVDGNLVRKITPSGQVTTVAGQVRNGKSVFGYTDGPGNSATFHQLACITMYGSDLFVGDGNSIRRISSSSCRQ